MWKTQTAPLKIPPYRPRLVATAWFDDNRPIIAQIIGGLMRLCYPLPIAAILLFASTVQAQLRITFVDSETQKAALTFIPDSQDGRLQELRGKAAYYTEKEFPRAHQGENETGFFSADYNTSGGADPIGHANREFPWDTARGLRKAGNANSLHYVIFPETGSLTTWTEGTTLRWSYPPGTVFIEVLTVNSPRNYRYTFEVGTRTKQQDGHWSMNVYRPFKASWELEEAARQYEPDYKIGADPRNGAYRLTDAHPLVTFDRTAYVQHLPPLKEGTVVALLDRPFQSIIGKVWAVGNGVDGFAGTADGFHIFPQKYEGAYFEVNNKSCMTCHNTTIKLAAPFQPRRQWYKRVRGDDGVFTVYPVEPFCISRNGAVVQAIWRRDFIQAGLIRR